MKGLHTRKVYEIENMFTNCELLNKIGFSNFSIPILITKGRIYFNSDKLTANFVEMIISEIIKKFVKDKAEEISLIYIVAKYVVTTMGFKNDLQIFRFSLSKL